MFLAKDILIRRCCRASAVVWKYQQEGKTAVLLRKYLLNSVKRQEINNYDHWKRLVGLIPLWGKSWERKLLMQPENKFSSKRRRVFIIIWWFETRSLKFRYFRMKTVEGRVSFAKILRKAKNCDGGNGSLGFLLIASKCFHNFPEVAISESFSADFYVFIICFP